jgi:hypothetical protein
MSRKDLALIGVAALCLISLGVRTLSYEALGGVLLGAVISGGLSWYFYQQASDDLRKEAEQLRRETEDVRHYINALITYLEEAGVISVVRDENGRPIEVRIIKLSAAELGARGLPATIKVDDPPEGNEGG